MPQEPEEARMQVTYEPIGVVHSPFKERRGMPIQPTGGIGIAGTVEVFPEFAEGLKDLAGFSHVFLLYYFHQVRETRLTVTPFMDVVPRGVFATRAPVRPNPIGLSVVKLVRVDSNVLHIENVDILDGTPLLDIKPYVPQFDHFKDIKRGWLDKHLDNPNRTRADDRFGS